MDLFFCSVKTSEKGIDMKEDICILTGMTKLYTAKVTLSMGTYFAEIFGENDSGQFSWPISFDDIRNNGLVCGDEIEISVSDKMAKVERVMSLIVDDYL